MGKAQLRGRHRESQTAQRGQAEAHAAQVMREADGFTTQDALILDAELNIRDGQGSIKDYANYFRNTQIDRGAATQRGLLSRAKGRAGFEIGRSESNDLYAAFANKAVSADKAAAIAAAAPNNDTLQRAALKLRPALRLNLDSRRHDNRVWRCGCRHPRNPEGKDRGGTNKTRPARIVGAVFRGDAR